MVREWCYKFIKDLDGRGDLFIDLRRLIELLVFFLIIVRVFFGV